MLHPRTSLILSAPYICNHLYASATRGAIAEHCLWCICMFHAELDPQASRGLPRCKTKQRKCDNKSIPLFHWGAIRTNHYTVWVWSLHWHAILNMDLWPRELRLSDTYNCPFTTLMPDVLVLWLIATCVVIHVCVCAMHAFVLRGTRKHDAMAPFVAETSRAS